MGGWWTSLLSNVPRLTLTSVVDILCVAFLIYQFIAIVRDDLPFGIGRMPGLEPSLYGLVLVIVILFEPGGIYGRWIKIKHWFQAYPLKRRTSFHRQKSYARSERLR